MDDKELYKQILGVVASCNIELSACFYYFLFQICVTNQLYFDALISKEG